MTHVLVTGATGFVASQLIARLLAKGHQVRGTVRSLKKHEALAPLRALAGASERLELVEADLLTEGSFDTAAVGTACVMHTASPYVLDVKDPQKDLVDPALLGTRNVLAACAKAGSVTRVVLTSSITSVSDKPPNDRLLTEDDWNDKSSLTRNPYYYSKVLAERAAWDFLKEEKPTFDLVVINPGVIIGPSNTAALNSSASIFVGLLSGKYPGVLQLGWGFVDVRDVADAHILAMDTPRAKGRYLCVGETMTMRQVVQLLRREGWGKGTKLPKANLEHALGNALIRIASRFQPQGTGSFLRTHIGRVPRYANTRIQEDLGLRFTRGETTVLDTLEDLAKWSHIKPRAT